MKMKYNILILTVLLTIAGCSKQDYYDIPKDENGNAILTGISSTTTTGISTLDGSFSATATFATAKVGDVMRVELLKLQLPSNGGTTTQLLPLAGTEKSVTVGSDMKATVTYTRDEAKMVAAGDAVTVVFNGATDYAKQKVEMVPAITVSKPKSGDKEVDVARTAETAYFIVTISPKESSYTGALIAKRKNGANDNWVNVGDPFTGEQPLKVPISGDDFAANKDTMFYSFSAAAASYADVVTQTVIVRDPYFFIKKAGKLTLGGSSAGLNLIKNRAFAENNDSSQIAVSGSLILKGGSAWLAKAGNSITFVPTTSAMYEANNLTNTIAAFNAGTPVTTADPGAGTGVYIYKIINGPLVSDVYYGMIKITEVIPDASVSFEYRIGDQYAHLLEFK